MLKLQPFLLLLAAFSSVFASACLKPQIVPTIYTTQDATVVKYIAYIAEFNVKCEKGESGNLYALMEDRILPIATIAPSKYQLSWTEDIKTARTGEIVVKLYDENGYAAARKAVRAGENISSIQHFSEVLITHPGIYKGPWISCEFLAAIFAIAIAYYALHFRSKLIS